MKQIFLLSLLAAAIATSNGQIIELKREAGTDDAVVLQRAFAQKDVNAVLIRSSFVLNAVLKIPKGKTLKFEPGCMISGNGTINGGIIDAGYQQKIFDSSLTVNPEAVNQYFSVKWFGAKGDNVDDYAAIQKSINTCLKNGIRTVYIPLGYYKISKPLIIRGDGMSDTAKNFCTLEILGESSFWDSNTGTELRPTFNNTFAIGIQRGKGCKIRKLRITGQFQPPKTATTIEFYNIDFKDFTDKVSRDNRYSPYSAIVIDPFTNVPNAKEDSSSYYPGLHKYYGTNGRSSQSGSTATEIEEVSITGFVVGICSAPNGKTRNAEITMINKVQFANCKLCISGGQDQEKDNTISNIYCWGGTHTVFATGQYGAGRMAGNWIISNVNIAGNVSRFIYNQQHGYFATHISHVYAETLGTWGTINSELASEISGCTVDFAYQSIAGKQTLITSWGKNIVYRGCNFRYYGEKTPLTIEGDCVFDHCYFSGPVEQKKAISNVFYNPGTESPTLFSLWSLFFLLTGIGVIYYFIKRRHHKGRATVPVSNSENAYLQFD
ncbi:MAG: hypothetical protein ABIN36_11645 [Ferruginibacter sp.]